MGNKLRIALVPMSPSCCISSLLLLVLAPWYWISDLGSLYQYWQYCMGTMAHRGELQLGTPALHNAVPEFKVHLCFQFNFLLTCFLESSRRGLKMLGLSWLWPGPALGVVGSWRVSQWVEGLFLLLFQTKRKKREKNKTKQKPVHMVPNACQHTF